MSRSLLLYCDDILDAIEAIDEYVRGTTFEEFVNDPMRSDAVLYQLVIIGEAVRQIPEAVREHYPEIEWRKVAGVRDVIVHGYHRVELSIVWSIMAHQLGPLRDVVRRLVDDVERVSADSRGSRSE